MKKGSTSLRKNIKTISQGTTAQLLLIIIVLTGTMTTTSVAVWATTTGEVPTIDNGTDVDAPTRGTEGLAEEAQQVGTAVEEPSSLNQSELSTTTSEENASSIEGPVLEEPLVPSLNQTETAVGNISSAANATAAATNATNTTTTTGLNGKIAFVRGPVDEPKFNEIYIMNAADGSGQTRLTNNDASDSSPTWSPDGTKIAFSSRDATAVPEESSVDIYVMNAADGSNVTRLTENGANDSPRWSPDGEKIAFVSSRDGNLEIYVMNSADGSNVTRLTNNNTAFDGQPTWSPDGEKIAFVSSRDDPNGEEGSEIYVMNAADGSGVTRMTNNSANDITPDWGSTTTSPPTGGGGGGPTVTPPPEQVIEESISTIQNLDSIPQSLKTSIISLLRQVLDSLNDDTNTATALPSEFPPLPFNMT